MNKSDVEVIEYGKVWINQGHVQEKLGIANIADRTQYYSDKCGKYQPCRMFIENSLAVEITMRAVKTQAAVFKNKFVVDQHDNITQITVIRFKTKNIVPK